MVDEAGHEGVLGIEALALRALGYRGARRKGVRAYFHRHIRVRQEIAIPRGMRRRAARGGDDDEPVAIARVAQRCGPRLAASGPDGGQQEHRTGEVGLAGLGAKLRDDVVVVRVGVAHGRTSLGLDKMSERLLLLGATAERAEGSCPHTLELARVGDGL